MIERLDIKTLLAQELINLLEVKQIADHVRVRTHCLYPSNGFVTVAVRHGRNSVIVSDEGGAVREAVSAGVQNIPSDKSISKLVHGTGLVVTNGVISTIAVPFDAIASAVLLTANASKEIAEMLYKGAKIKRTRDLKSMLSLQLGDTFSKDHVEHNARISGLYKKHRFSNVITFRNGTRLIVDPVQPDANSINSRLASHMDVKRANDPNLIQSLVYDETDTWRPEDLSLLGMTEVPLIRFSQSEKALKRLLN